MMGRIPLLLFHAVVDIVNLRDVLRVGLMERYPVVIGDVQEMERIVTKTHLTDLYVTGILVVVLIAKLLTLQTVRYGILKSALQK